MPQALIAIRKITLLHQQGHFVTFNIIKEQQRSKLESILHFLYIILPAAEQAVRYEITGGDNFQ